MSREGIAVILKEKRKQLGLTVEAVTASLQQYGIDVSPKSLYSYESGHRQPDADILMALCEIYQISDVLDTFGYKKSAKLSSQTIEALNDDAKRIALHYNTLSDKDKIIVKNMIDSLSEKNDQLKSAIEKTTDAEPAPEAISGKKTVFRAARSKNNAPPTFVEESEERRERLRNAPKIISENDL